MKPSRPYSRNLHRTIFIYSTSFIVILAVLVSVFTIGPLYGRLLKVEEKGLVHTAETQATAVGEWVLRARELALQIGGRTPMQDMLAAYNKGGVTLSELVGHAKPRLMEALLLTDELVGISRFDQSRKPVVQSGVPLLEDVLPQFPEEDQTFHLGWPQYIGGSPYGVVVVDIKDAKGGLLGTDILLIDTTRLEKIVVNPSDSGRKLDTVIGFRHKEEVHSFFPLSREGKPDSPEIRIPAALAPFMEAAIKGERGLAEVGEQIVAYAPVEGSSWGCLVRTDKTEFRTPVINSLIRAFSGILVFLVIGLLALWFFLKPMISRVYNDIRDLEEEAAAQTSLAQSEAQGRERAGAALKAAQELDGAIFNQVQDPLIVYNLEGRVIHLNPAFSRVFGWGPDECLGRKLDYAPPGQKPEPEQLAEGLEQGRAGSAVRTRRYNKKGRLIGVSLFAVFCRDERTGQGGSAAILRTEEAGPGRS